MSNRTNGTRYEAELCKKLSEHGWWAHNIAQNQAGQPADIIAVKNDIAVLIDCKDCENDRFPLSRIEPNQEAAMTKWKEDGNKHCYFALRVSSGEHFAHFDSLNGLQKFNTKSLNINQIQKFPDLSEWMEVVEDDIRNR